MKIKRNPTYRMHVYKDWQKVRGGFARIRDRKDRNGVEYESSVGHTRRTAHKAKIAARKTRHRREPKEIKSREDLAFRRGVVRRFNRNNVITPGSMRRVREALNKMKEAHE